MADESGVEKVVIRNSDGEVTDVATMKDGVLEGETLVYSGGKVMARLQFSGGKQNGPAVFYDDAGQVLIKALYQNGKLHGDSLYFGPAGNLVRKSAFVVGQLEGYTVDYYPSGRPREVTSYKNNVRDGEAVQLTEDGKVTDRQHYREGRPYQPSKTQEKPAAKRLPSSQERRA
jgi:antitoxin component YwqK of YwqJK toxin-antitoxin module